MRLNPLNPTVFPEDKDIARLISGDPACSLKRFLLGIEMARDFVASRFANGPFLPATNNILALD